MKIGISLSLYLSSFLAIAITTIAFTYIGSLNNQSVERLLQQNVSEKIDLFVSQIKDDLIAGNYRAVAIKSEDFFKKTTITSIRITLANGEALIDLVGADTSLSQKHHTIDTPIDLNTPWVKDSATQNFGHVKITYKLDKFNAATEEFQSRTIQSVALIILVFSALLLYLGKNISRPLERLKRKFDEYSVNSQSWSVQSSTIYEIDALETATTGMISRTIELTDKLVEKEKDRAVSELAKKVAHDIRSPLSAIQIVLNKESGQHSRIVRLAVNRISEIANELISQAKSIQTREFNQTILNSILFDLINEKKLEWENRSDILIELNLPSKLLYSNISANTINRVLSNLLNNSMEAKRPDNDLRIEIALTEATNNNQITVTDNGRGIRDSVLEKLNSGIKVTCGKENSNSGTGIGVSSAHSLLQGAGGSLNFTSRLNDGTSVTLTLPQHKESSLYLSKLDLFAGKKLVILDDDSSTLEKWRQVLHNFPVEVNCFKSPLAANKFIETSDNVAIVICDYNLTDRNGIDFLCGLKTEVTKILITTEFDDAHIVALAQKSNIPILPKFHLEYIHFRLIDAHQKSHDAILIDNDVELIHKIWKMSAETKGKKLECFSRFDDFVSAVNQFDRGTPVYIDLNLESNGPDGIQVAERLFYAGFRNLYITSGEELEDLPDFIRGKIGKKPIWDL